MGGGSCLGNVVWLPESRWIGANCPNVDLLEFQEERTKDVYCYVCWRVSIPTRSCRCTVTERLWGLLAGGMGQLAACFTSYRPRSICKPLGWSVHQEVCGGRIVRLFGAELLKARLVAEKTRSTEIGTSSPNSTRGGQDPEVVASYAPALSCGELA